MNAELHLGTELHSGAELQNEVEALSISEISVHERDIKLSNRDVHRDLEVERQNEENRGELGLSK